MITILFKITLLLIISFFAGAILGGFLRRNFNFEVETLPPAAPETVVADPVVVVVAAPESKVPEIQTIAPVEPEHEEDLDQKVVVEVVHPAAKSAKKPVKSKKVPTAPADAAQEAEVLSDSAEMKRPVGLFAPRDDKADDLKLIRGIGPTNERKLNQIGIYHYDQIANWSVGEAEWINSFLEFPGRVDREDWIAQAKALVR